MVMSKNDLKYVGGIGGKVAEDKIVKPVSELKIWAELESTYGTPLFEGSIGDRLGEIKSMYNKEVLMTYLSELNGGHFNHSIPMYNQCNFAKGVVKRSHHGYVLNVNGEETIKVPLSTLVHIVPVDSMKDFSDFTLLQFTFLTGHTGIKHSTYLRDVLESNPLKAANNLIDVLSKDCNLHIPVRLKNIQWPEQGYEKQLDLAYAKKGIFLFEKNKTPKYDNM